VPSLHAAYTLLIALFLWRLAPRWGRVLLAAYPLAMAFALVYTAEHYFSDILVGWVLQCCVLLSTDADASPRAGLRGAPVDRNALRARG
jgi:membrane-associated phospholipid phosphatase